MKRHRIHRPQESLLLGWQPKVREVSKLQRVLEGLHPKPPAGRSTHR